MIKKGKLNDPNHKYYRKTREEILEIWDKNMFSSGLNMTRNTLDELTSAGYVSEVTRQSDGTELINKGSESVPFNAFGQNVGKDEIDDAGIDMNGIPAPTMNNSR